MEREYEGRGSIRGGGVRGKEVYEGMWSMRGGDEWRGV